VIELKLISINVKELKPLIHFSYLGDADLIDKYQGGDRSFEDCVEFNYNEIRSHLANPVYKNDMKLWKISLQSGDEIDDIGYCVTVKNEGDINMLFSFAFNMHYRKKVFLIDWLKEVEKVLGEHYYTCLWNKNTRAIDFFKKNGFEEYQSSDKPFKYLTKGFDHTIKSRMAWQ